MIRKIIGWTLAILSAFLLAIFTMIIVGIFDETPTELRLLSMQTSLIGSLVCAAFAILLLIKKKVNTTSPSMCKKIRKIFGYIFIVMFMFSIPGLQHFDIYEILPRVILLLIAYFLLKSYKTNKQDDIR